MKTKLLLFLKGLFSDREGKEWKKRRQWKRKYTNSYAFINGDGR